MIFTTQKLIRFQHCDPAGIVFYPRYYELLHEAQEDWLAHIGFPEHALIARGIGVPIVNMQTDFLGMSRHGDVVHIDVELWRLGNSSLGMRYCLYSKQSNDYQDTVGELTRGDGKPLNQVRLRARSVVVYSQVPNGKALRIPDEMRAALLPYLNEPGESRA